MHFPGLDVTCSRLNTGCYLFEGECVVGVEEAETVAAGFELSKPVLAMPVLVAAETRWNFRFKKREKSHISRVLLRSG